MNKLEVSVLLIEAAKSYKTYTHKVAEVECNLSIIDNIQVVSFRGTEASGLISEGGWRDVIRDLRTFPWYDRRVGWSHAGFLKGAQGIVDKALFGALRRELPIVIDGHSLGGSLGINAAAILNAEGFNVTQVVTFGAPRTLLKSSAKRLAKSGISIIEYSNPGDPIPDMPFRWWGYRHVNEVHTSRPAQGYSIAKNHMLEHYSKLQYYV